MPEAVIYNQELMPAYRPFAASNFTWYKTAVLASKSRTGTRQTKGQCHLKFYFLCLSCPFESLASQNSGFIPREWLAANGLLLY